MEDDISVDMALLSVDEEEEEEEEGLVIEEEEIGEETIDYSLCSVKRFLTERVVNFNDMKQTRASLWRSFMGMSVIEEGSGLYVFRFFHTMDVDRVLEMTPWTFDHQLLILERIRKDEKLTEVALFHTPLWVQVHCLLLGLRSERVLERLGNSLGTFLESNARNFTNGGSTYMRIRIKQDVRVALKQNQKIRREGKDWAVVQFRYEHLPSLCFLCGLMGHTEHFCHKQINRNVMLVMRKYVLEIRAMNRRNQLNIGAR